MNDDGWWLMMMDDDIDGDSDDDDQNDYHDIIIEQWILKRYFSIMYLNKCSFINERAIYLSRGILLSIRHDFDFICIT